MFDPYTNPPQSGADVQNIVNEQTAFFQTGATLPVEFRVKQLKKLQAYLIEHEQEALEALHADLGKSNFESYVTELGLVFDEISYCLRHVRKWARPKHVHTPLAHFPTRSTIYPYPYGVAAILSPWNYPLQLALIPMVDALTAGNTVVMKPSMQSEHTSAFLEKLCQAVFDPRYVMCLHGSAEMNDWILEVTFDKIMFTGSPKVGREIMAHAAKSLTSVTLELGGKSPLIIDKTANLKRAGERVAWGKFLNSGQTCVAPDYALVHEDAVEGFVRELTEAIHRYYGENPLESPDYPHLINKRHYDMVTGYLDKMDDGAQIVCGGDRNPDTLQLSPTVVTDVTLSNPLMAQEIFGPILPIITWRDLDEVIRITRSYEHPLACYVFTEDIAFERFMLDNIPSGGAVINDVVIWASSPTLPFGGLQNSGIGSYHGKAGFDAFTHFKSTMKKSTRIEIGIRNPPFNAEKFKLLKLFMPER